MFILIAIGNDFASRYWCEDSVNTVADSKVEGKSVDAERSSSSKFLGGGHMKSGEARRIGMPDSMHIWTSRQIIVVQSRFLISISNKGISSK